LTDWSVINLNRQKILLGIQAGEGDQAMRNQVLNVFFVSAMMVGVAFAQGQQQKVEFYLDGKVGNEVVKKGTYTVTMPEGNQGQIEIKVGKKVVAANVTKKQITAAPESDKMTYTTHEDGSRSVASITPKGKKYTLVIEQGEVARQPAPTAPSKPGSQR
jgi:hypothetical protein